ncbi:hypothetical protein [Streptomyces collinus]|uniref:hypothetical protein n=1 Tax=Streptomyces collinus TaxID=42684 RepID=UPI00294221CD|nr:hypothetical protein [Streptomyces collinus]
MTTLTCCAALVLLAGCGGGGKEPDPLGAREAQSVLPDAKSLPGWKTVAEPTAYPLKKARSLNVAQCQGKAPDSCAHVRYTGLADFRHKDMPELTFFVQTYPDAATAKSAYPVVWKEWKRWSAKAKPLATGGIGEQSDAMASTGVSGLPGSKELKMQVRVGSVIMRTNVEAFPGTKGAESLLTKCAQAFARRAEQVQEGGSPSAALGHG